MNKKEYLIELHSDPRFATLLSEIMKQRPQVPTHIPANGNTPDNTEIWKARSAEQRGFDVWLAFLNIK